VCASVCVCLRVRVCFALLLLMFFIRNRKAVARSTQSPSSAPSFGRMAKELGTFSPDDENDSLMDEEI
jgi:hypothetical protein